jgi:hypothetical protein
MAKPNMPRRMLLFVAAALSAAYAQKYDGPVPAKADQPYLKHASELLATEALEAREEKGKKDEITYIIPGLNSPVKTPLASPIFLMQADKISAERLGLYKLETKKDHREITFAPKKQPKPIRIEVTRVTGNLYRIEVDESLEPGEYSLSPQDTNQVFCFQVF